MLNVDYLQDFITIADTGKFNEAAELLYISQSSLSKRIMTLEKELGVPLFKRTTHGVGLTDAGIAILPYARRMIELRTAIDCELARLKADSKDVPIMIGSTPLVPLYRLSSLIDGFLRQQHCEIQIKNRDISTLKTTLFKSEFDFIITYDNGEFGDAEITSIPYTSDRLSAVVATTHPLASRQSVSFDELRQERFIKVGQDPIMKNFIPLLQASTLSFSPKASFVVDTVQQMLEIVRHGTAITLMGDQSVKHFAKSGVVAIPVEPVVPLQVKLFFLQPYLKETAGEILQYLI